MQSRDKRPQELGAHEPQKAETETPGYDLTPLFTILARQPPKDHDFRTCPICKEYGIAEI
jgi:hypothetical protein